MEKKEAIQNLEERKKNKPEQTINSVLPAGSPMFFYCRICGHLADIKPECYTDRPKKHCDACQELIDNNWIQEKEVVI